MQASNMCFDIQLSVAIKIEAIMQHPLRRNTFHDLIERLKSVGLSSDNKCS